VLITGGGGGMWSALGYENCHDPWSVKVTILVDGISW
jgi:hypothetical protein